MNSSKTNLKSNVLRIGKVVTQIICNNYGMKKTIRGIKADTIEQSQFTKFETVDGRLFLINDPNVFWIEVFNEDNFQCRQDADKK